MASHLYNFHRGSAIKPGKSDLAINQSRRRADGSEYNAFPTLWIFTKIDGRWGVQFRSSFLLDPNSPSGDVSE
jgi:hypothetical protein